MAVAGFNVSSFVKPGELFLSYNQQTQWKTLEFHKSREYYCILSFNQSVCGDLVVVEPETVQYINGKMKQSKVLCLQTVSYNQGDRVRYRPQQFITIGIFFLLLTGRYVRHLGKQVHVKRDKTQRAKERCYITDLTWWLYFRWFGIWAFYSSDRIMLMNDSRGAFNFLQW